MEPTMGKTLPGDGRNVVELEERAQYASLRASLYLAASAAFADAPDAQTLSSLIETACAVSPDECSSEAEAALFGHLRGYAGEDVGRLRTRVASEYAELFVGPRPPLAPYYESMYLGHPRRLFTQQTADVRDCYEREGLAVTRRNRVPDDHIAYELEFMGRLCEREAGELFAGDDVSAAGTVDAERLFLKRHLAAWTAPFARRVCDAGASDYYAAWARYVEALVADDLAELETL